jgi:hypothetical protein
MASDSRRHQINPAEYANPGASDTAIVYDDISTIERTAGITSIGYDKIGGKGKRVTLVLFVNQDVTVYHKWAAYGSTNLRTFNGDGSGEAVSASTLTELDFLMLPGRNQISIATGTAPTTWEVCAEIIDERGIGQ